MNKTILAIAGIIVVLAIIVIAWYVGTRNNLVGMNEEVNAKWAQVETQYQRRIDLIPNIVATVQGAKDFEQETLTEITRLRSTWQDNTQTESRIETANKMESALARLLVIVENYPELKSNQNFLALQDELANTENKIAVERGRYNEAVRMFNAKIKSIPANVIASGLGYTDRMYFNAATGAENPPEVEFN